ncbi:cell envelope integrity protein TolA [Dongia deserti]|uniref:cell envelope integrity protein TolA n=1 Tax=Dongia deserti TaxID=2268030 RepID=UPI000E659AB2|nr:cell envelope integrity protein TolA [Dongia deserti]
MSESEEKGIRNQVERNRNLGSLAGSPNLENMVIKLRIELLPDGTVTRTELLNSQPSTPDFRKAAESAIRAVMISSPLKLVPGKTYESMILTFHPGEVVQ